MTLTRERVGPWYVGIAAVLLAWVFVALAYNAIQTHQHSDEVAHHEAYSQFLLTVAGEDSSTLPLVGNKLAVTLRERLGPRDPNATDLPEGITHLRGSSNEYGGVAAEIGENPFESRGCGECGPLDSRARGHLLAIKRGEVYAVIEETRPDEPNKANVMIPLAGLFLMFVLLPLFWLSPQLRRWQEGRQLQRQYPIEMKLVSNLNDVLGQLPRSHPQRRELTALRDQLQDALAVRSGSGEHQIVERRIERLVEEATVNIAAFDEGNRALEG